MSASTSTTRRDIGLHRKALRVRAGLTVRELVERAGVSHPTIGAAEAGVTVSEGTLRAIASALGVTAAEYLGPDLEPAS